jgi:hypothetical protein
MKSNVAKKQTSTYGLNPINKIKDVRMLIIRIVRDVFPIRLKQNKPIPRNKNGSFIILDDQKIVLGTISKRKKECHFFMLMNRANDLCKAINPIREKKQNTET